MIKAIKKFLSTLIILVIFVFLVRGFIINWAKIPFNDLHFNIVFLLISYLFLVVRFIIYAKSWQKIMHVLGSLISYPQSFWMISTTQIAKYLPGGIWYTVGRVYIGKKEKISGKSLTLSMVLETCLLLISSIVIFLFTTIVIGNYNIFNLLIYLTLLISSIIILQPHVLSCLINFFLRIFKKPEIRLDISYLQMLKLLIYFFCLWLTPIIGFYFLINSIYPIAISKIFNLAAAFMLSWITGFIVLFAPGGLGVREGMMTLLLSPILPTSLAIAISFIARIWITLFEIVIFFVGLLVKKISSDKNK